MTTIINIFKLTKGQVYVGKWTDADDNEMYRIDTTCTVDEADIHRFLDTIENLNGIWTVLSNHNGKINVKITFEDVPSDSRLIPVVRVVNRHWFETKFINNREALAVYCEDILLASK